MDLSCVLVCMRASAHVFRILGGGSKALRFILHKCVQRLRSDDSSSLFVPSFPENPRACFPSQEIVTNHAFFHGPLRFLVEEKQARGVSAKPRTQQMSSSPRYLFIAYHDGAGPARTKTLKRHNIAPRTRMSVTTSRFMIGLVCQNAVGENWTGFCFARTLVKNVSTAMLFDFE